jgi:hypothetical protein
MAQAFDDVVMFIIRKNMEIILDNISADFNIDREKLDPYLKMTQNQCMITTLANPELSSGATTICQGKTKKGESCPNKAKPNTMYCGKHSS